MSRGRLSLVALVLSTAVAACADTAPPADSPTGARREPLPDEQWTARTEAPLALTEVAATAFGGQVWTAGGLDEAGAAVTAVQVYDPTFDTWSQAPSLPEPVHHAALVATVDGLVLLGGYRGAGFDRPTDGVLRLDPASGTWEQVTPLPAPRAAGAAAWDGQRIVYAGGVGAEGVAGTVWALSAGDWTQIGELSAAREHLGAATDGRGRTWFLAGRVGGLGGGMATVDLVEADTVRRLGKVPTSRGGVAGFANERLGGCVVGGEVPGGTVAAVECITAEGRVSVLPDLGQSRHGLGAVAVDGVVYALLGGRQPGLSVSGAVEALRLDDSGGR